MIHGRRHRRRLIGDSRITNGNSGNPIQVSLLTGDVCAGYETRSYTLLPDHPWSTPITRR